MRKRKKKFAETIPLQNWLRMQGMSTTNARVCVSGEGGWGVREKKKQSAEY